MEIEEKSSKVFLLCLKVREPNLWLQIVGYLISLATVKPFLIIEGDSWRPLLTLALVTHIVVITCSLMMYGDYCRNAGTLHGVGLHWRVAFY